MTFVKPETRQPPMIEGHMPLIDVSAFLRGETGALERAAGEMRYAGERVGFYILAGHGIDRGMIDRIFDAAKRFHDQPLETKLQVKAGDTLYGYMPMKGSQAKSSKVHVNTKPDLNEAFFVGPDKGSQADPDRPSARPDNNKWPCDLEGFREDVQAYTRTMSDMARKLMPLYARALGMPATFFDEAFASNDLTLRLTHYPPAGVPVDNEFGIAPHTDGNFATFLPANPVGGLSIGLTNGRWFQVPFVADTFVVNAGDILARWSNDVFISTPHRAINRSGVARYAAPFFLNPHPDTVIECLPSCVSADNLARYAKTTQGEYIAWFRAQNFRHLEKQNSAA